MNVSLPDWDTKLSSAQLNFSSSRQSTIDQKATSSSWANGSMFLPRRSVQCFDNYWTNLQWLATPLLPVISLLCTSRNSMSITNDWRSECFDPYRHASVSRRVQAIWQTIARIRKVVLPNTHQIQRASAYKTWYFLWSEFSSLSFFSSGSSWSFKMAQVAMHQRLRKRRNIREMYEEFKMEGGDKKPLSDYLRAWQGITTGKTDVSDPDSFFMIAGYHGT